MWDWIRFVCSAIALVAFSIRLSEENDRKDPNPVLCAALAELIAYEGTQVRTRVEDLCDRRPIGDRPWLKRD
jgi:hypothetical protein